MSEKETYAEKINRLLRKAESTTPEEAKLLYAKAQELMEKYAIDEAMLKAAGKSKKEDPIIRQEFVVTGIYRFPLGDLTWRIMQVNNLKAVLTKNVPRTIGDRTFRETYILTAVGYQSDIENARLLETSLHIQALSAMNLWWMDHEARCLYMTNGEKHREKRQFLFSFAQGAHEKLKEGKARGQQQAEAEHGSTGVALVLRDRALMVKDEFERLYPELRTVRSSLKGGSYHAHNAGHAAGRNADVGQPRVGGNRKQLG